MMAKLDLDWCECMMAKLDCVNGHKIRLVWMYVSQLRLVCICDSQVRLVWIYDSQLRLVWVCDSQVRLVCVNDSQLILVWMHYIQLRFGWAHDSQVRLVLCEWTASLDWFECMMTNWVWFEFMCILLDDRLYALECKSCSALLQNAACIHPGTVCCMLWPLWSWAAGPLWSWASVKLGSWASVKLSSWASVKLGLCEAEQLGLCEAGHEKHMLMLPKEQDQRAYSWQSGQLSSCDTSQCFVQLCTVLLVITQGTMFRSSA